MRIIENDKTEAWTKYVLSRLEIRAQDRIVAQQLASERKSKLIFADSTQGNFNGNLCGIAGDFFGLIEDSDAGLVLSVHDKLMLKPEWSQMVDQLLPVADYQKINISLSYNLGQDPDFFLNESDADKNKSQVLTHNIKAPKVR